MSSPRVALLTPTFWPVANRLLVAMRGLAEWCQRAGAEVALFTEKLEPDWPTRLRFRDWNVVRIERPIARPWSRGRFGKALVKALEEELSRAADLPSRWDAVIVCDWPEALFALDGQAGRISEQLLFWFDRPLPPEARGNGAAGRAWQAGLRSCSSLLSPHPLAVDWIAGLSDLKSGVTWIPDYSGGGEPASRESSGHRSATTKPTAARANRDESRKTLAEIHPLLNFERQQLLAVCAAELSGDSGVYDLLNAWRHLRRDEPRAQLLLIGDGPQARAVWSRIHDWHLQGNVVMPGCFDDHEELLRAADFYIHPLRSDESCPSLSMALQMGIPCVLSKASPWSAELAAGREAWIFEAGSPASLLDRLRDATQDPGLRQSIGAAGAVACREAMARATPLTNWLRPQSATRSESRSGAGA